MRIGNNKCENVEPLAYKSRLDGCLRVWFSFESRFANVRRRCHRRRPAKACLSPPSGLETPRQHFDTGCHASGLRLILPNRRRRVSSSRQNRRSKSSRLVTRQSTDIVAGHGRRMLANNSNGEHTRSTVAVLTDSLLTVFTGNTDKSQNRDTTNSLTICEVGASSFAVRGSWAQLASSPKLSRVKSGRRRSAAFHGRLSLTRLTGRLKQRIVGSFYFGTIFY